MMDCYQTATYSYINLSTISCDAPESYIVIDDALLKRIELLQYYTSWDFESATHEEFKPSEIITISEPTLCIPNQKQTLFKCGTSFIVDLERIQVTLKNQPFPAVIVSQKYFVKTREKGEYSLLIYPEVVQGGNIYKAVIIRSDLIDTLMVRLYFMKGFGFDSFIPVSDYSDPLLGRMVTYKINATRIV